MGMGIAMEVCPCKDCVAPKRHPGCHGACQEYIDWKEAYNETKATVDARKEEQSIHTAYSVNILGPYRRGR